MHSITIHSSITLTLTYTHTTVHYHLHIIMYCLWTTMRSYLPLTLVGIKLVISFSHICWFSFHFSTGQLPPKSHYLVDLQNFDLGWTVRSTPTMVQLWALTNWTLSRSRLGLIKYGGEHIFLLHLTPSRSSKPLPQFTRYHFVVN